MRSSQEVATCAQRRSPTGAERRRAERSGPSSRSSREPAIGRSPAKAVLAVAAGASLHGGGAAGRARQGMRWRGWSRRFNREGLEALVIRGTRWPAARYTQCRARAHPGRGAAYAPAEPDGTGAPGRWSTPCSGAARAPDGLPQVSTYHDLVRAAPTPAGAGSAAADVVCDRDGGAAAQAGPGRWCTTRTPKQKRVDRASLP